MRMRILILEDNADRREAMKACLFDRFPQFAVTFHPSSSEFIRELDQRALNDVVLVSLVHDLEPVLAADGSMADAGDGLEVAQHLAHAPPACPILVHTTNIPAGAAMMEVLSTAGWSPERVIPYDDTTWIGETWMRAVRNQIVNSAAASSRPAVGQFPQYDLGSVASH